MRPEHPHWPLIALTLLTQLALGVVSATVVAELILGGGRSDALTGGAVVAALAGGAAMAVSLLHLGRPIQAWRALRNVRTSWLSREVALFGVFALGAIGYAAAWFAGLPTLPIGILAIALGAAGVYASGRLYLVPARPVWNSARTLIAFFATALASGPVVVLLAVDRGALGGTAVGAFLIVAAAGSVAQLLVYQALIERISSRGEREYRGTARLLFQHFRVAFFIRVGLAITGCALLAVGAVASASTPMLAAALACTAAGELIGRYLFYVTVTPMSTAGTFFK